MFIVKVVERPSSAREPSLPTTAGLTLIETLVAAAMLLVVAVMLLPLFIQSSQNNVKGADSTEMSNHAVAALEEFWQLSIDEEELKMANADAGDIEPIPPTVPEFLLTASEQLVLREDVWRLSAKTPLGQDFQINDGGWIEAEDFEEDDDVFRRRVVMRQFRYGDIFDGLLSIDGTTIVPEGDPYMFDSPLANGSNEESIQLRELEVEIESTRQPGKGNQRQRLFRIF